MATPWDRAAAGYLAEWVPRFLPYHADLVREIALRSGDRVLVPSAGPGAEVLAVARTVGPTGFVLATDKSDAMVALCAARIERAQLGVAVECRAADAVDARGGPWDAVVCAFGLWQLASPTDVLAAWSKELTHNGKVGIITWGPSEKDSPFDQLQGALRDVAPGEGLPASHIDAGRDAMAAMFAQAGLAMVRHTTVRHTITFATAQAFVTAMREACTWRRVWEELGDARFAQVAARFYERWGGPDRPMSFDPVATLAIAGAPG